MLESQQKLAADMKRRRSRGRETIEKKKKQNNSINCCMILPCSPLGIFHIYFSNQPWCELTYVIIL